MSRTIRRTNDKKRNKSGRSHFESSYTNDYVRGDANLWGVWYRVKLEGKEFDQAYWKFHGDTCRGFGWGNHQYSRFVFEKDCRMKNKEEIIRYYKDENYEVFAYKPGCLSWDR